jgi:hypothetical protein
MKTKPKFAGMILLVVGLILLALAMIMSGCGKNGKKSFTSWKAVKSPDVATQLKSFVAQKEAQVNSAPGASTAAFVPFFAAAQKGDWLAVNNEFKVLSQHVPSFQHSGTNDERLTGTRLAAILEIQGAFAAFSQGDQKYPALYANDIIESIPPGSIYFGGTDNGRFLVTAMQKSQVNGDPFFTLTQNALTDGTYLDYLRSMYGDKIYIPTPEDLQRCFRDYDADAKVRLQNHQLKRGENVTIDEKGGVEVSGIIAVMEINGLIAKVIFDKNSNQDFYIEQSFPLDWMYPYLEPHGLIFKLNHQPLDELSDDIIQQDHDYWTNAVTPLIGDWLNDDTSVADVVAFAHKVFYQHDYSGFAGGRGYVENKYATRAFASERSNIARLYVWRMNRAGMADEKARMARAADFAFRQSLALCPSENQTVNDYVDFLRGQNRNGDAALVRGIGRGLPGRN